MLTHILTTKKSERSHIHSSRTQFRAVFSWKNAKIIGEIKPRKPGSQITYDHKVLAEKISTNPAVEAYSILIDETFFGGNITNIELIRKTGKPTLFKEFVYETTQIDGASYYGYDAVLLIKKIFLNIQELKNLVTYCLEKNIEPLIEIDNESDLNEVLQNFSPVDISIGINCRNLDTMEIDRQNHFALWRTELSDYHILALSGITDFAQIHEYRWKYDGVLIGTLFTH